MKFALFLSVLLLNATSVMATRPIIPLYAAEVLGAPPWMIGALVSAYAILPMVLALHIGKLLDRYGARTVTAVGGSGLLLSLLMLAAFPNLAGMFASQLLSGLCNIFLIISFQKTVGNRAGDRNANVMWLTLMFSFSELLGPLFGGFVYQFFGFRSALLVSAGMSAVALTAGLLVGKDNWEGGAAQTAERPPRLADSFALLKSANVRKVLLLSGVILYTKDLFVAYLPIYGASIGIGAGLTGMMLSFASGMAIAIRFSQRWLLRTFGRRRLLLGMLVCSGLFVAAIPFLTMIPALFICAGLIGAGLGLGQPISLVYALDAVSRDRHGEMLGLRMAVGKGLQFTAPFAFGVIGELAGLMSVFFTGGLLLLVAAFGTRIRNEHGTVPKATPPNV